MLSWCKNHIVLMIVIILLGGLPILIMLYVSEIFCDLVAFIFREILGFKTSPFFRR